MSRRHTPESFWKRVAVGAPDVCWPWKLYCHKSGYGIVTYQSRDWKAHRLAYTLAVSIIPRGMLVRHTCDNPPCCNPAHLLLGLNRDNSRDMVERNRQARITGESNEASILTESQAREAWGLHLAGVSYTVIGKRLGVHAATIQDIASGRTWQSLGIAIPKRPRFLTSKRIAALRCLPVRLDGLSRADRERYRNLRRLGLSRTVEGAESITDLGISMLQMIDASKGKLIS